jgi:antirestriction protein ArdC
LTGCQSFAESAQPRHPHSRPVTGTFADKHRIPSSLVKLFAAILFLFFFNFGLVKRSNLCFIYGRSIIHPQPFSNMSKIDVYDIVNEKILSALGEGRIPWQRPWDVNGTVPCNYVTRKPYQGVNAMLLWLSSFQCPFWATFKQISEVGGSVKKGERSSIVVFWNWLPKRVNGQPVIKADGKPEMIPFLRYYNVFNLSQTDGIDWQKDLPEKVSTFSPIERCELVVANMPQKPLIKHGGNRACYIPSLDTVEMPDKEQFKEPESYYSTLFHELGHSTGHSSRLGRKGITEFDSFGSEQYGKEELIAEMTASYLCAHTEIFDKRQAPSVAYLQNWIAAIKGDKKLIVQAAAQAQKATNFILGIEANAMKEGEGEQVAA